MKTAFIFSDELASFNYGAGHPLKPFRLKLARDLIGACGLLGPEDPRLIEATPATKEDLSSFHSEQYLGILEACNSGTMTGGASAFGLGPGDNPVFPGMFDWSRLVAGASLRAASLVDDGEAAVAFNIAGGLHHALASRASGFCYINDPVLAIRLLAGRGRRVAYIDIDAHHGDGVQAAFYDTDRVLTVSLHETGQTLFPGSGSEQERGVGRGEGYSINVPLPPESDDALFLHAFEAIVPPAVEQFKPDIVVSQLGVDTFVTDPLAHLNYTTKGFCGAVRSIKLLSPKWVALGGGGYDLSNVARAWTLAWAVMNDAGAPSTIPEPFLRQYGTAGFQAGRLEDEPFVLEGPGKEAMKKEVDRVVAYIKEQVIRNW